MRTLALTTLIAALALLPGAAGAKLVTFSSPSHNIGCALDSNFARCDVAEHSWRAPRKPPRCMLDWGDGMLVQRSSRGQFVCAGDTTLNPRGAVLAYGRSRSVGRFICTSRSSGMSCRSRSSGHGFTVSRSSYRAF